VEARALCVALAAALCANISIVGLNQCFDIELDRVNKPYLPLASGEWSLGTGVGIVVVTGAAAVALAASLGSTALLATVVGSLLLGIAYSVDLPIFRWKYNPVAAAGCIISVRAVLVQVRHPLLRTFSCSTALACPFRTCH
jgi:homogentisate phytyltransferase / homogentisate geranylgeranyltransferase